MQFQPLLQSIFLQTEITQTVDNRTTETEIVTAADNIDPTGSIVQPEPTVPTENQETHENYVAADPEEKPPLTKVDSAEKSTSSSHKKAEKNSVEPDPNKEHRKSKDASKAREKRSPPLKPKHKPDEPLSNGVETTEKIPAGEMKLPMPKAVTALRSAAIRPVSARPSAPRRRDRNVKQIMNHDSLMHDAIEPKKTLKTDLMSEYDDGENIVITDVIHDTTTVTNDVQPIDNVADGKQGHLVQQILETQTAFLSADNDAKHGETVVRNRQCMSNCPFHLAHFFSSFHFR